MHTWCLRDDGVPIEIAAAISEINRGAFTILRAQGAFGPANCDPVPRASLREVAAARALTDAERAGIIREHALPVITQIADSAYLRLAIMELSRQSWDPRCVSSSAVAELARKMHSDEGLAELQDRLGVRCRNTKRFVIFGPDGPVFADSPPELQPGQPARLVDIWNVAQRIRNNVGGKLFHGARGDASVAA